MGVGVYRAALMVTCVPLLKFIEGKRSAGSCLVMGGWCRICDPCLSESQTRSKVSVFEKNVYIFSYFIQATHEIAIPSSSVKECCTH